MILRWIPQTLPIEGLKSRGITYDLNRNIFWFTLSYSNQVLRRDIIYEYLLEQIAAILFNSLNRTFYFYIIIGCTNVLFKVPFQQRICSGIIRVMQLYIFFKLSVICQVNTDCQ